MSITMFTNAMFWSVAGAIVGQAAPIAFQISEIEFEY